MLKRIILNITDRWHLIIWKKFIQILLRHKVGRIIHKWFRLFCRVLWVFNITAPPKGGASCFSYIFIRYPNKFRKLTFKEKIKYLKRFNHSLNI